MFDERLQYGNGLFHGTRALDYLGKEHFPFAEQLSYMVHTVHEGLLDDGDGRPILCDSFGKVGGEVGGYAFDERLLQALGYRQVVPVVPAIGFFCLRLFPMFGGKFGELFGGVGTSVQNHIFDKSECP